MRARLGRFGTPALVLAGPVVAAIVAAAVRSGTVATETGYNLALCAVYGMVVLSVTLLAGWAGVWSVGHPAMFAIGSYTAVYGSGHGWSLEQTLVLAALLPAASGALLGYAGARFSVLYIALLTMAFDLVVLELVGRWTSVTGGDQGAPVGTLSSRLGLGQVDAAHNATTLAVLAFGVALGLAALLGRSSIRLRAVAAKSHAPVSRSLGIAPELQTALGFALSGALTGVAGAMLATMTGFVSPDSFSLGLATNLIAASVLGGVGSIAGSVVGGGFLTYAGNLAGGLGISQPILEGVVLIAVLLLLPRGVVPSLAAAGNRLARRIRPGPTRPPAWHGPATPAPAGPARRSRGAAAVAGGGEPLLTVHELGVRFGGLKALTGVSLEVRAGEVVGIIGPNGAGKTSLINVLSGLPAGGQITGSARLRDVDLLRARPTARPRLGIGRTFQHAELFGELTLVQNVLASSRWTGAGARRRALAALDTVGLTEVADRLPRELPFGLQKRADLARAVSLEPDLLVLDEPLGGLDATERAVIAALVRDLQRRGTAIVVVDHVIEELFPLVDRVVAFDFGTPIASGSPEQILADAGVRAAYFGTGGAGPSRPGQPAADRAAGVMADRDARARGDQVAVRLHGIEHHYDGVSALRGIDLEIPSGALFGIAGANGAGKSTLGRIITGQLRASAGRRDLPGLEAPARPSLVPEGRALFRTLTVRENLEVAGYAVGLRGRALRGRLDEALEWLPGRVRDRLEITAGALSGGEQQLLAIARGLVCRPTILVLDEPALGLAPVMVEDVYERITGLAERGLTVVLLEQLLGRAVAACTTVAVLRDGRLVDLGSAADEGFLDRAERAYLGTGPDEVPARGGGTNARIRDLRANAR